MFDSLIELCSVCGQMVLLDQTQVECARKHHCSNETPCPLRMLFTELDFSAALAKGRLREKGY
jgi:hypothetical protein